MLASMLLAHAQGLGPEERYVGIYYTIQEADTLNEKGGGRARRLEVSRKPRPRLKRSRTPTPPGMKKS